MNSPDRRQYPRANVSFPVTVEVDYGPIRIKVAQANDICVDGICLRTSEYLPPNVPLVIHFPREWGRVFAIAKVVRKLGHKYGCQFLDLHPGVSQAIERAVLAYHDRPEPKSLHTLWRKL